MSITLTKGTKEYVSVTVVDILGSLSSLTTPVYDVLKDDNSTVYSGATATASGLVANCLVDISSGGPSGLLAAGTRLRLFLTFTNSPEIVRLGPVVIQIIDDGI